MGDISNSKEEKNTDFIIFLAVIEWFLHVIDLLLFCKFYDVNPEVSG